MDVVAEADDELVEKYLEDGTLSHEDFERGLQVGVSSGHIIPIIAGSVEKDMGGEEGRKREEKRRRRRGKRRRTKRKSNAK